MPSPGLVREHADRYAGAERECPSADHLSHRVSRVYRLRGAVYDTRIIVRNINLIGIDWFDHDHAILIDDCLLRRVH